MWRSDPASYQLAVSVSKCKLLITRDMVVWSLTISNKGVRKTDYYGPYQYVNGGQQVHLQLSILIYTQISIRFRF